MRKTDKNIKKIYEDDLNKGITLVALIVTIIILLILAGVAIAQLTGNGLFENAKLAKEKHENAQESENAILGDYESKINQYVDGARDTITVNKEEWEQLLEEVKTLKETSAVGFPNYSRSIAYINAQNYTYTATEPCYLVGDMVGASSNGASLTINNTRQLWTQPSTRESISLFLSPGDTVTTRASYGTYGFNVYALK